MNYAKLVGKTVPDRARFWTQGGLLIADYIMDVKVTDSPQ